MSQVLIIFKSPDRLLKQLPGIGGEDPAGDYYFDNAETLAHHFDDAETLVHAVAD